VRLRRGAAPAIAALAALGAAAGHAAAADPILPLSEVQPGMVGEARTVVRGTEIVRFPVTVIDVQRSTDGPGGTQILARAEGPLIVSTGGVAQGMSGSPVYVTGADGVERVIGAVAFGTGDEANVLIGLTPIEQMIDSSSGQRGLSRAPASTGAVRRMVRVHDRAAAVSLQRRRPDLIGTYPLARWTVTGASPRLVGPLSRALEKKGIQLASIGPRTARPPAPLQPGSSFSVLLAGGDIALGAIGTVTYVDGTRILGFGHPFLGGGRSAFLLGDSYVYEVIPAPITSTSYIYAEPGSLQGMIVNDRFDGVTGVVGPVEGVDAVGTARDTARGTESTVRTRIAPDDRTLPIVAGLLQDEPAVRVRDGIRPGTVTVHVSVSSPALPKPLTYRNVYASAGDVVALASGQAARLVAILGQNSIRQIPISAIRVDERIQPAVRAARIIGASVSPRHVEAGGRAVLNLRLQPWRDTARTVRIPVRIPSGLDSGPAVLLLVPKSPDGFDPFPADLTQNLGASTPVRRAEIARVDRLAARAKGTRIDRLVAGVRRATDDRHDAVRLLGPDDDADTATDGLTVPVPFVIYGGRAAARVIVR
jgi:SpoIVB peptidase S55